MAEQLRAAIHADPDDPGPRLVYADWLESRDLPAWAEIVRIGVERETRPPWDVGRPAIDLRNDRLRAAGVYAEMRAILPTIPGVELEVADGGVSTSAWVRSFERLVEVQHALPDAAVTAVTVPWPTGPDEAARLLPIPGLRRLRLGGFATRSASAEPLVECPALATVEELELMQAPLHPNSLARLLARPFAARLAALSLEHVELRDEHINALVAHHLPRLRRLVIQESTVTPASAMALAEWRSLGTVDELWLYGFPSGSLAIVLSSPRLVRLRHLHVFTSALRGWPQLADGPPIEALSLQLTLANARALSALAADRRLQELRSLRIDENRPVDVSWFGEPFRTGLQRLHVRHGGSLTPLVDAVAGGHQLHELVLGGRREPRTLDSALATLAAAPGREELRRLDLLDTRGKTAMVTAQTFLRLVGLPHLVRLGARPNVTRSSAAAARIREHTGARRLLASGGIERWV